MVARRPRWWRACSGRSTSTPFSNFATWATAPRKCSAGSLPGFAGGREIPPHGVEEERAAAACRVQDPLLERVRHGGVGHRLDTPLRGVELPEPTSGVGADDALVQRLHHVVLDVGPAVNGVGQMARA